MEDSDSEYLSDAGKKNNASPLIEDRDIEAIRKEFVDDLNLIYLTENPLVVPEIELVYVLAGRSTVLGRDADGLDRVTDPKDDLLRVELGINIARQVNALKAGKKVEDLTSEDLITPIFYHGRRSHNDDLEQALDSGLFDYPKGLFTIREAMPENTLGQAASLNSFLDSVDYRTVALVSSAYHLPRVARTFGNLSPQAINSSEQPNSLGESRFLLYGIDRKFENPGTDIDLVCEVDAMLNYSLGLGTNTKPTISIDRPLNTALTSSDLFWLGDDIKKRLTKQPSAKESNQRLFTRYHKDNFWGNRESKSGVGSTLDNTKTIREKIPILLEQFNFQTMLDIPCGDMNYMKHVDLSGIIYIGADIVPDIVKRNRETFKDRDFYTYDITTAQLPCVDLVLCRDLFIHMPNAQIQKALENVARTGAEYFMCEMFIDDLSQCPHSINADINSGQFRPTNVTRSPFMMPEPIITITEDRGEGKKVMGLFDLSKVRQKFACDIGLNLK